MDIQITSFFMDIRALSNSVGYKKLLMPAIKLQQKKLGRITLLPSFFPNITQIKIQQDRFSNPTAAIFYLKDGQKISITDIGALFTLKDIYNF
jgi:hypothetical protein